VVSISPLRIPDLDRLSFRVHRVFVAISLLVIATAFSYPVWYLLTEGIWKTVRHTYSPGYILLSVHAGLAAMMLTLFLVQFGLVARRGLAYDGHRRLHKLLGRFYLFVGGPAFAATACWIAVYNEQGFDDVSVMLITLAVFWFLVFAGLAWRAIRRRDVSMHFDWIVMSFVLISIAALIRVVLYVDAIFSLGMEGWQYRCVTVFLIVGQLHAFAVLRKIYAKAWKPLWALTASFLGVLVFPG
jgi:hypothetical protein